MGGMGVLFLIIYILFIVVVIGFLINLFIKYFGFEVPDKLKELVFKVPKAKETIEKISEAIKKINFSEIISSLTARLKAPKTKLKLSSNVAADKEDIDVQNEILKVSYSNLYSETRNKMAVKEDFQIKKEYAENYQVKKVLEDDEFKEEEKVLMNVPVETKYNSAYNSAYNAVSSAVPDIKPGNFKYTEPTKPVETEKEPDKMLTVLEKLAAERAQRLEAEKSLKQKAETPIKQKVEKPLQQVVEEKNINKQEKFKPSKKKGKYQIMQTGFASIFFSRFNNVTIIPYAKDIQGKGRAMDGITFLKYPITSEELGKAIKSSIDIENDVYPFTDKELVKKLEVKEWEDFTCEKRHISIRFENSCGYILNTTTRNLDGSYRLNCPGGIEKIVRKDASTQELGDTVLNLLERCKS